MFPWPEMPLSESLAAQSASTRLISDDGRTGFILLRFLEEDKQSFAQNDESIKVLRQLTADVRSRHPGTKIGLTGLPIIEYDEMQSSEKSMSAGHDSFVCRRAGGDYRRFRRISARHHGDGGAGGRNGLGVRMHRPDDRPRQRPEHRLRFDSFRPGHRLRHLLRRALSAIAARHRIDLRGPGGDGRQHGAGRFDRRGHLGDRVLRGRVHRISRRGATRRDRRRRRPSLLAGPGDRPAGDDSAVRRRRRDGESARAA